MKPFASVEAAGSRIEKDVASLLSSQAGEMLDSWIYSSDGRLFEAKVSVKLVPVTDPRVLRKAVRFIEADLENARFEDDEAPPSGRRRKGQADKFEDFRFPVIPAQK